MELFKMSFFLFVGDSSKAWDEIKERARGRPILRFDPKLFQAKGKTLSCEDIINETRGRSMFDRTRIIAITNCDDIDFMTKAQSKLSETESSFRESLLRISESRNNTNVIVVHFRKPKKNTKFFKSMSKISKPKIFKEDLFGENSFDWVNSMIGGSEKIQIIKTHNIINNGITDKSGKTIKDIRSIFQMLIGALSWKLRTIIKKQGMNRINERRHSLIVEIDSKIRETRNQKELLLYFVLKWSQIT